MLEMNDVLAQIRRKIVRNVNLPYMYRYREYVRKVMNELVTKKWREPFFVANLSSI